MPTIPGRHFVRNSITKRNLLYQLVRRDFHQRFIGSAGGWLWGFIQPLVLILSWVFVFQICLHNKVPTGETTDNYTIWLACGYLPFMLFQETLTRSVSSMVDNSNLITKTVFPAEFIPVAVFLSTLVQHLLALSIVLTALMFVFRHASFWMAALPFYMVMLGLFAIGIAWVVASLQVYLRDTAQVLTLVLTFWFWTTPIFISEKQYPVWTHWVLRLNPLAYLVRAYRDRLLSSRVPSLQEISMITLYSCAAFILGGLFFRQLKRGFADVL
jgi:ABC-type polysaccharide/polyol phosphate export permease